MIKRRVTEVEEKLFLDHLDSDQELKDMIAEKFECYDFTLYEQTDSNFVATFSLFPKDKNAKVIPLSLLYDTEKKQVRPETDVIKYVIEEEIRLRS